MTELLLAWAVVATILCVYYWRLARVLRHLYANACRVGDGLVRMLVDRQQDKP